MKHKLIFIFVIFLLNGCAGGVFSVNDGQARFSLPFDMPGRPGGDGLETALPKVYIGMQRQDLYRIFKKFNQVDYRRQYNQEWITFADWTVEGKAEKVTFHLIDAKVRSWQRSS